MSTKHLVTSAALGACLALAVVVPPAVAGAATPAQPALPQITAATDGATWLASQFNADGYIPVSGSPGSADLSSTANAVLALASANTDPSLATSAVDYLESNVDAYVTQDGADGPAELGLLILDAKAVGVNPDNFGGTNLVSRLLATEQTSGTDAGLFGTETQVGDYSAGGYQQGLALAALAAAGVTGTSQVDSADSWLLAEQCSNGGWTSPDNAGNPCNGSPADYEGPDTNSTALAVEGLSAQGALGSKAAGKAFKFFSGAQDSDGGWGYEPNAASAPGSADPDSTALVLQGLLALGKSPTVASLDKGSADPVAALLSFQVTSGSGTGSFLYPGSSDPNLLATYQAVPAVAGVAFPFDVSVTTTSLPAGKVGLKQKYSADLAARGGSAPYKWRLVSGTLPPGLKLAKSTGVISGKPTTPGAFSFAVEATDAKTTTLPHTDSSAWANLTITVAG